MSPFELPYLAVAHLRQAEIYDELDQPERAVEHYSASRCLQELTQAGS